MLRTSSGSWTDTSSTAARSRSSTTAAVAGSPAGAGPAVASRAPPRGASPDPDPAVAGNPVQDLEEVEDRAPAAANRVTRKQNRATGNPARALAANEQNLNQIERIRDKIP